MSRRLVFFAMLVTASLATTADAEDLGSQAVQILEKNCFPCHGQNGSKEGGIDFIMDPGKLVERKLVVPLKPNQSRIYIRMTSETNPMPEPGVEPRPSKADIALIRKWIESGAPAPQGTLTKPRPYVALNDVLKAVDRHLDSLQPEDRPYQRYFSLTHLHNLKSVRSSEFPVYRAALSKLVNSLSWKPEIVLPKAVDEHRTVFAIDLRDLDWDKQSLWKRILEVYPYGLTHENYPDDHTTRNLAQRIYRSTGSSVPVIRADWFIATASRPPLYHILLQIPKTSRELQASLKVDLQRNFARNRLARAGFKSSGVSKQNRLVERHTALYGAYWISYDFLPVADRKQAGKNPTTSDLALFPLGPKFHGNQFHRQAFEADGGEIIFHLPNGLQGYMLIDGNGRRIDKGPIAVVRDKKESSGSPVIVNGISCMACHQHGMITNFEDTIRLGTAVQGAARRKVQLLYPKPDAMQKLLAKDQKRFLDALDTAIGPYLRNAGDEKKPITAYPEPISKIGKWYLLENLGPEEVAAELGLKDANTLVTAVKFNTKLKALGLGPLAQKNTINRETWESIRGTSAFQNAALELQLGTPFVQVRTREQH